MPDQSIRPDSVADMVSAAIDSPRLLQLLDHWQSRRRDGGLPGRADFDPLQMRFILGNLLLVDVERPGPVYRYRLVGSNLSDRLGIDLRGRSLDEHPDPTFRAQADPVYNALVETGTPYALCRDEIIDGRLRQYQVLMLPLAADGRTVDMIMAGYQFDTDYGR